MPRTTRTLCEHGAYKWSKPRCSICERGRLAILNATHKRKYVAPVRDLRGVCIACGSAFEAKRKGRRLYCYSAECLKVRTEKRQHAEAMALRAARPQSIPCANCGTIFAPIDSRGRLRSLTKFCSAQCKRLDRNRRAVERMRTDPVYRSQQRARLLPLKNAWYAKHIKPETLARKAERAKLRTKRIEAKEACRIQKDAARTLKAAARLICRKHAIEKIPSQGRVQLICPTCKQVTAEKKAASKRREKRRRRTKDIQLLRAAYVKRLLKDQSGLKPSQIPPALVEAKRAQMKLKRLIEEKTK